MHGLFVVVGGSLTCNCIPEVPREIDLIYKVDSDPWFWGCLSFFQMISLVESRQSEAFASVLCPTITGARLSLQYASGNENNVQRTWSSSWRSVQLRWLFLSAAGPRRFVNSSIQNIGISQLRSGVTIRQPRFLIISRWVPTTLSRTPLSHPSRLSLA